MGQSATALPCDQPKTPDNPYSSPLRADAGFLSDHRRVHAGSAHFGAFRQSADRRSQNKPGNARERDLYGYQAFSGGRTARPGRLTHHTKCRLAGTAWSFNQPLRQSGGESYPCRTRHVATTADQVAHQRHPARDQRQFPRAVRLLPVRLLCQRDRQGVLPLRETRPPRCSTRSACFWLGALMRRSARSCLAPISTGSARRQRPDRDAGHHGRRTVVIAFCPTYATIGVAAPIIVLLGRLLQGFSAGVELGGVSVYLSEIATPAIAASTRRSSPRASRSRSSSRRSSAIS